MTTRLPEDWKGFTGVRVGELKARWTGEHYRFAKIHLMVGDIEAGFMLLGSFSSRTERLLEQVRLSVEADLVDMLTRRFDADFEGVQDQPDGESDDGIDLG